MRNKSKTSMASLDKSEMQEYNFLKKKNEQLAKELAQTKTSYCNLQADIDHLLKEKFDYEQKLLQLSRILLIIDERSKKSLQCMVESSTEQTWLINTVNDLKKLLNIHGTTDETNRNKMTNTCSKNNTPARKIVRNNIENVMQGAEVSTRCYSLRNRSTESDLRSLGAEDPKNGADFRKSEADSRRSEANLQEKAKSPHDFISRGGQSSPALSDMEIENSESVESSKILQYLSLNNCKLSVINEDMECPSSNAQEAENIGSTIEDSSSSRKEERLSSTKMQLFIKTKSLGSPCPRSNEERSSICGKSFSPKAREYQARSAKVSQRNSSVSLKEVETPNDSVDGEKSYISTGTLNANRTNGKSRLSRKSLFGKECDSAEASEKNTLQNSSNREAFGNQYCLDMNELKNSICSTPIVQEPNQKKKMQRKKDQSPDRISQETEDGMDRSDSTPKRQRKKRKCTSYKYSQWALYHKVSGHSVMEFSSSELIEFSMRSKQASRNREKKSNSSRNTSDKDTKNGDQLQNKTEDSDDEINRRSLGRRRAAQMVDYKEPSLLQKLRREN